MECYDSPRFSDDIDFDSINKDDFFKIVEAFCKENNYEYRRAKDTSTVQRAMIHFDPNEKPLKIEASFRNKYIDKEDIDKINNITVYKLDSLAILKSQAYIGRDKIRDMYDICYIVENKMDELAVSTVKVIRSSLGQKGLEQYDYLVNTQEDPLINKEDLAESLLNSFEKLGLSSDDKNETKILENIHNKNDDRKK